MIEIQNKKAYYDYFITDQYEAGLALSGTEIKSIRKGAVNLKDSFVRIKDNECFVINMYIAKYEEGNRYNHDERRQRKLLLHKKEILKIKKAIENEGYSIVPLKLYFKKNKAKLLIGVGKGKKLYDKRETIKRKEADIEARRQMRL